jgi:hypothetical protein
MKIKNLYAVAILFLVSIAAFAQGTKKLDKIIKENYQVIECTISKMSDKAVEYSLPGETMQISLDTGLITRIDFASGRSQTFDVTPASSSSSARSTAVVSSEMKQNTIAVLPVPYLNSDTQKF